MAFNCRAGTSPKYLPQQYDEDYLQIEIEADCLYKLQNYGPLRSYTDIQEYNNA